ncbi:DUF1120 domain-containing protein [Herbaspirillum lusitanum]|uniref:DUF1120 domain-containing protein n=1 Tax=Herbaspirillum lusitanum TaxID=213312 RepID=UPI002238C7DF|nr:DUF1120 domain-containing protein [Herbaspirillum lusitanum]MCW5301040.1 DUF1120 domain-containing protein [Herbaspirillum lusitanum]
MNKQVIFCALIACVLGSATAWAADTAEMQVKGRIYPGACLTTFTGDGTIDFGVIPASRLTAGQYTRLPAKSIVLALSCDAPTRVALKFSDNRTASRVTGIQTDTSSPTQNAHNFGLGTVNGKKVGGYAISIAPGTTVDGKAATRLWGDIGGNSWNSGFYWVTNDDLRYFSFNNDASMTPGALTLLQVKFNVHVGLNKPENLDLQQDVPLDGSTTIEVVYL